MPTEPFFAPSEYTSGDLTIRAYRPGDGAALNAATISSYEHLRPWMPWATRDQTAEQAEAHCWRFLGVYLQNQDYPLGIWLGDELAGGTGFHLRGRAHTSGYAEIGMWISAAQAGRGLGTRALRAMLEWGFGDAWGWERLEWRCDTRNVGSARVAEKNGMPHEGTLRGDARDMSGEPRDTHIFGMLRRDWRGV